MPRHLARSARSRHLALGAVAGTLALLLSGCGGDAAGDSSRDSGDAAAYVEPTYDGPPADLTADEVCALLDEKTVAEHLDAEVSKVTPGSRQPDCQWFYKLPAGPATNLQVQVMSMEQTGERLGTEALEWGLSRAPEGSEITEVESLGVPNGSYEFYASTVVLAIDPAGRLLTVSAHSETPEHGRIALVEAVLAALTENHS